MKIFLLKYVRTLLIQFIKFGIVGFFNTLIFYTIYFILVYFGLHYLIASTSAFFISVFSSFFLNNKYVFKNNDEQKRNIIHSLIKTYISYAFSGLVLQNLLLFLFIDILHISKYFAPFLCLLITVPLNFILIKFWAFQPEKHNKDKQNEKIDKDE